MSKSENASQIPKRIAENHAISFCDSYMYDQEDDNLLLQADLPLMLNDDMLSTATTLLQADLVTMKQREAQMEANFT